VPLDVLFGNPERSSPQLSPDGTRLAFLAPVDGVLNVWEGSVAAADFRPVTDDRVRGIRTYLWAQDDRHLLYLQDTAGDENWHVHSVDLDSLSQVEPN
jgi:Tol biopolymer transport system component